MKVRFDSLGWLTANYYRVHIEDVTEEQVIHAKAIFHGMLYGEKYERIMKILKDKGKGNA